MAWDFGVAGFQGFGVRTPQRAIQTEGRRSLDGMARLPSLLAQALPVTDVTPLETGPPGGAARLARQQQQQLSAPDRAWLQSLVQGAVQELAALQQQQQPQQLPAGQVGAEALPGRR